MIAEARNGGRCNMRNSTPMQSSCAHGTSQHSAKRVGGKPANQTAQLTLQRRRLLPRIPCGRADRNGRTEPDTLKPINGTPTSRRGRHTQPALANKGQLPKQQGQATVATPAHLVIKRARSAPLRLPRQASNISKDFDPPRTPSRASGHVRCVDVIVSNPAATHAGLSMTAAMIKCIDRRQRRLVVAAISPGRVLLQRMLCCQTSELAKHVSGS